MDGAEHMGKCAIMSTCELSVGEREHDLRQSYRRS